MEYSQGKFKNHAIPIFYISNNIGRRQNVISKSINRLISGKAVERVYTSSCPVCQHENLSINECGYFQCDFCGEKYYSKNIDEKYRLLKN